MENEEHWIKTEDKLNYVYFNFLTCSAIFMYFELVCVLSKYKDVDAIWFKNARLDTNPITILTQQQEIGVAGSENCFHFQRASGVHIGLPSSYTPHFIL